MAPLIRGMSRKDAQWSKFKHSYMYNDVYHLRRTKFVLYQLASNLIGIGSPIGAAVLHHYASLQRTSIPDYPTAHLSATPMIAVWALNIATAGLLGTVFGAAMIFDLFWPEREEAPSVQFAWKMSAAWTTVLQLAACLATTIVVATGRATFVGVDAAQLPAVHAAWTAGGPLVYLQETRAVVAVVFIWLGWAFAVWSTIVMWRSYAHNNKYGPFAAHVREGRSRERSGEGWTASPLENLSRFTISGRYKARLAG